MYSLEMVGAFFELLKDANDEPYPADKRFPLLMCWNTRFMFHKIVTSAVDDFLQKPILTLGNSPGLGRDAVENRLKALASYGFIKVVMSFDTQSGRYEPAKFFINPILLVDGFFGKRATKEKRYVAKKLVMTGRYRNLTLGPNLDISTIQGFKDHCRWGHDEDRWIERDSGLHRVAEEYEEKAEKIQEDKIKNLKWKQHLEQFIDCAAYVWAKAQQRQGHGSTPPNWLGAVKSMAPAAKKERSELAKTFEHYGANVSMLAWYVFTTVPTRYDDKGKLVFDLNSPHSQYKTVDNKPSQFAKHFNSVIASVEFQVFSRSGWGKGNIQYDGKMLLERCFEKYPNLLEVGPRDGGHYSDRLCYHFGDQSTPQV